MKPSTTLLFCVGLALIAAATACKSNAPVPSAEVNYIGAVSQGELIKVAARGYGSNDRAVIDDAERRAFETLLFTGLPGSAIQSPMVDEPNARQNHKDYFRKLLDEQGYRNYLSSPGVPDKVGKDKRTGKKSALVTMEINVLALRRELEQKNHKRKFGF